MNYTGTYNLAFILLPGENGKEKVSIQEYLDKETDPDERRRSERNLIKKIIVSDNGTLNPCIASLEGVPQSEIDKALSADPDFYIEGNCLFSKKEIKPVKEENGELYLENKEPNFLFGKEPWVKLSTGTPGEIKYALYLYEKE